MLRYDQPTSGKMDLDPSSRRNLLEDVIAVKAVINKRYVPYTFLLPYILIFTVFGLFPLLFSLFISFTDWTGVTAPVFVGLKNYAQVLKNAIFYKALTNTGILILGVVPLQFITGLFLAVVVNQLGPRLTRLFKTINFLPFITIPVAIGLLFQIVFNRRVGVINQLLMLLGIVNENINWLGEPTNARIVTILMIWWKYFGYYMIVFVAGMSSISSEIYEAAYIDGAGWRTTLFKITIPLLRNPITFLLTTGIIGGMQAFDEPNMLFSTFQIQAAMGGPERAVLTNIMYFYEMGFQEYRYGFASAIAFILLVITFILSISMFKLLNKKEDTV